jgi:hypothetical protein
MRLSPNPDTGEEYPHTNTQLYGILSEANRSTCRYVGPSQERLMNRGSDRECPLVVVASGPSAAAALILQLA